MLGILKMETIKECKIILVGFFFFNRKEKGILLMIYELKYWHHGWCRGWWLRAQTAVSNSGSSIS